ncbi:MAG: glycosyltransferase, partial [Nanoarchaeota archaeon]|nr:glycosyltransferase [Nanoarchaeota archaeon]
MGLTKSRSKIWLGVVLMNILGTAILWTAYFISLYFSIFLVIVYLDKREHFREEKSNLTLTKEPVISILIPAYNEEKTIIRTLESVRDINYPKNKLDVIVIDDGSNDGTKEQIENFITKNKLNNFKLRSHKNMGKGASLNDALKVVKGEFFACLDADSFVDADTLKKQLSFYYKENDPKLAIITPAMKVYKPKNVLQKIQWIEYLIMIFVGRLTSQLDSLYVAPGPFSLYKTGIIKELGGFHEKHLTEDQEIAYRVQEQHYRIKQCFDAYVFTISPDKLVPFYRQRRRWYLGSITCAYTYKKLIANKKYGDFGIMQMIKNVIGYFLAFTGMAFAFYFLVWPLILKIKGGLIVNFDIMPYLRTFQLTFDPLFVDIPKVMIFGALFLTSLFFFYQAHVNAKEKLRGVGYLPIIPYFAFYYLLKGSILI